jgi:hypothetical protein
MMLEALLLDFLIVIAVVLLVPLGAFRGGLREVCASAGLLLGILISDAWAPRWGSWVADLLSTSESGATFMIAAVTMLFVMVLIGYGASSAFNNHPGPGGRMFGAAIAALNGVVIAGFLVNNVAKYLNDGEYPAVVQEGYVSRGLSSGFDVALLAAGLIVVCLTVMGMVVREREVIDQGWVPEPDVPAATTGPRARTAERQVTPDGTPAEASAPEHNDTGEPPASPVTVRQIRHWEEPEPVVPVDPVRGWQKTWPKSATSEPTRPPWAPETEPRRMPDAFRKVPPANQPQDPEETLRQWIAAKDEKDDR